MKKIPVAIATAFLTLFNIAGFAASPACEQQANDTPDKVQACMALDALMGHLKTFQQQADQNTDLPGTRFTGTEGYTTSRDYIAGKLAKAGYHVSFQDVPIESSYIPAPRTFELKSPESRAYQYNIDYLPLTGSGAGDITAAVQTPSGDAAACQKTDFAGFKTGNMALIARGTCNTLSKITNALSAGASAIIIYNDSPEVFFAGVGSVPSDKTPLLFVSSTVGQELKDQIDKGRLPVAHIHFNLVRKTLNSQNILAESPDGNPDHIVMAGAHLDSTSGNAGMNDNGSAAATVLETALILQRTKPVNKLRFAWWTGEELGLLGSNYYVEHLSREEKAKIKVYLNYEILGAPNGGRMIMGTADGVTSPGSEIVTQAYVDYFNSQQLKSYVFDPTMGNAVQRSDMYAFIQAGIPAGYLVTGAELPWNPLLSMVFTDLPNRKIGVATHPCYHRACDKLSMTGEEMNDPNFDFDLYLQMSKAAAWGIYTFSMNHQF